MQFQDVIGQDAAKKYFLNRWKAGTFPHAMLVLAKEGYGGLPLALAMANYILCENKGDDSCGQCPGCKKVAKLEHADLHFSFPAIVPKANHKALSKYFIADFRKFIVASPYGTVVDWLQSIGAENKQGNIPAEECREIIDKLNLKSYEGGGKVMIIWRPEYLGTEGNILLKMVEEPPADTFIIMVAENIDHILPTILSRTQLLQLAPIPMSAIQSALVQSGQCDEHTAMQIAHLSEGSYYEALQLIQHTEKSYFPEVRRWFNALFTNNMLEISKIADDWSKLGRDPLKNLLQYIIHLLENCIRATYLPVENIHLLAEERAFVNKLAEKLPNTFSIQHFADSVGKVKYYIERNTHAKTQIHALSIRMIHAIRDIKVPEW